MNIADCYWVGSLGTYGSARGSLVTDPSNDAAFATWKVATGRPTALPWPQDAYTGQVTADALDAVLISYGLPLSGLGSISSLAAQVVSAASLTASAIALQIYSDAAHQAAGQNAATIVAVVGGAPTVGNPFYVAFNNYAAAWNMTPANFAALIQTLTVQSMVLSGALTTLEAAAAAAASTGQLATMLATYETAVSSVVSAINAMSPPAAVTTPAAITIKGVNA